MREGKIAYSEGVADENVKRKFAAEGYDIVEMESAIFSAALGDDDDFKPVLTHIRCISDTLKTCVPAGVVESGLNLETGGFKISPLNISRNGSKYNFLITILPLLSIS